MNVGGICTRNVVSIAESQTLRAAATTMREHHVGALLVVSDEAAPLALGIVTDRDLVVDAMANGIGPDEATMSQFIAGRLLTIDASAGIDEALAVMQSEGIRRLLVTTETGTVTGMLSLDDVLEALAGELVGVAATVRGGIERESLRLASAAPMLERVRVPLA